MSCIDANEGDWIVKQRSKYKDTKKRAVKRISHAVPDLQRDLVSVASYRMCLRVSIPRRGVSWI